MEERLQKVLAQAGISSRRKAENLIVDKRVKVNGIIVETLGYKVSTKDVIHVDDVLISRLEKKYFLLNKPDGYLCVTDDKLGRKNIFELFDKNDFDYQLHTVGRLDFHTTGLIIVTNDGDLTKKMTHKHAKILSHYQVRVSGIVLKQSIRDLRLGFKYLEKTIKPHVVSLMELDKKNKTTLIEIALNQGHVRAIKEVFKSLNHPVKKITRMTIDFLTTDQIAKGSYRSLKIHEIKKLQNLT